MVTPLAAVPRSTFGKRSTSEDVTSGFDLSGKTILITGATSGIGLETVRALALRGAQVIAMGRTQAKAQQAIAGFVGTIKTIGCNQESFAAVAAAADEIAAMNKPLDVVICNAGILGAMELELAEGVAKPFAVNHLAHFILVNRLLAQIRAAKAGRIVMISSAAHHRAPREGIAFDNLAGEKGYRAMECYGQSKLANHLFARSLARRLEGVTANSLHPGVIATNIFHTLPPLLGGLVGVFGAPFMKSIAAGAATTCYVATAPALAGVTGVYFADCNPKETGRNGENDVLADKLWAASEDLTRAHLF